MSDAVNRAFSKQANHYDRDDKANRVLQAWRQQVYTHVDRFLSPGNKMIELNAGTGIDAMRFVKSGIRVLATDLSDGMVGMLDQKSKAEPTGNLSVLQTSYESLGEIPATPYDYIFSNFGGLNCTSDLARVTRHFPKLLTADGYVTLVIMPKIALWELAWILKGKFRQAFRRLKNGGVLAHLEGEYFPTYYYSYRDVARAMGPKFKTVKVESLGCISAPPAAFHFLAANPRTARLLARADAVIKNVYPFNRWGDHLIMTFQRIP